MLILLAAAITLGLLGSLSQTSNHDATFDAGSAVVTPPKKKAAPTRKRAHDPALLSTHGQRPPLSPDEVRLQSALSKAMNAAGPQSGALVYDLDADNELYGLRPNVKRAPASVEKLWTTTALMVKLGPNARLHTTLLGTGSERHGVWHGNLYLRGGGDPTFGDPTFNRTWEFGYGPTAAQLTEQLAAHGIKRVTGRLFADETMFDRKRGGLMTNYLPDVPDFGGQLSALTYDHGATVPHYAPAAFAAREMALVMRGSHITVKASRREKKTPDDARILATVSSPPLSVMTRLMDVPSDDLFAELFAKQLGVLFGRGGRISDGAQVIGRTIGRHLRPASDDPRRLRALAQRPLLAAGGRRPAARDLGHAGGPSAGGLAAHGRQGGHRPGDRPEDRRGRQLRGQDRHAELRHQPRRLLPQPRWPHARLRAVRRRPGQRTAVLLESRMIGAIARY